jgi:hypothetical protein
MEKAVTSDQLHRVLESYGYRRHDINSGQVVYRNPDRRLIIVLPELSDGDLVLPIDLLRVRKALANDGVVAEEEFESLFRIRKGDRLVMTDPKTRTETRVTAAAGESDGMVVVKHNGAYVACPVDHLRRDEGTTASARR